MSIDNIYNIRHSTPFWDTLANIYLSKFNTDNLAFASALFLVPNRRACKSLTDAFIRQQGLKPVIFPQIVPIADEEEQVVEDTQIKDEETVDFEN